MNKCLIKTALALLFLITGYKGKAQDLFDSTNTRLFAQYLLRTNNYRLAAQEFERLAFLFPESSEFKISSIQAYRLNNENDKAFNRLQTLFPPDSLFTVPALAREYSWLSIKTQHFQRFSQNIESLNLPAEDKNFYQLSSMILNNQYIKADSFGLNLSTTNNYPLENLRRIAHEAATMKMKKPGIAFGLSLAVPGLGKVYSGQWKDGLFSFLFTTAAMYQAYRGFHKNGSKSAYGWIYAGLGTGFYLGNLYGSIKSVHKYNNAKKHDIYHRTEEIFNHHLD